MLSWQLNLCIDCKSI